jgi:hypothetical protein
MAEKLNRILFIIITHILQYYNCWEYLKRKKTKKYRFCSQLCQVGEKEEKNHHDESKKSLVENNGTDIL